MYYTETRQFTMQLYLLQIREYLEALLQQLQIEEHAEERMTN